MTALIRALMTVTRINTDPVPELEMWVQELRAGLVHKRGLVQETYFKDFKDKDQSQQKYKYNYKKNTNTNANTDKNELEIRT